MKKSAQISGRSTKMDAALRRNADFASKPCVLQHFGSPPFNSITSKYCKGYKFHKKEDFKMLKNRGVVPGPVTFCFGLYGCTAQLHRLGHAKTLGTKWGHRCK